MKEAFQLPSKAAVRPGQGPADKQPCPLPASVGTVSKGTAGSVLAEPRLQPGFREARCASPSERESSQERETLHWLCAGLFASRA